MDAMPASLQVECLTVDVCQGGEFDFVLISDPRERPRAVGFVSDPRRINVAISRTLAAVRHLGARMAGRPGTTARRRVHVPPRTFVSGSRSACRWYAEPEAPGFVSVMHKGARTRSPGGDRRQEGGGGGRASTWGRSVRAQGVLRASEAAAKAAQQLEKTAAAAGAKERKVAQKTPRGTARRGRTAPPPAGPSHFPALMPEPRGISRTQRTGAADADDVSSDDDDAERLVMASSSTRGRTRRRFRGRRRRRRRPCRAGRPGAGCGFGARRGGRRGLEPRRAGVGAQPPRA